MRMTWWLCVSLAACLFGLNSVKAGYTLDLDYASFRANDSLSYVEVYAAIQQSALRRDSSGSESVAGFDLVLDVLHSNEVVLSDTFGGEYRLSSSDSLQTGSFFPHVFRYYLRPGQYQLRATLFQGLWEPREVVSDSIDVKSFNSSELILSDIELGAKLTADSSTSRFTKNGVQLLPNATRFFGERVPMLYLYAEAYGVDYAIQEADSYVVNRRVTRADDGKEFMKSRRAQRSTGTSAVIADGFPVATLRTGAYDLEVIVQSFRAGEIAASRKRFWIYREADFAAGRSPVIDQNLRERFLASEPDVLDIIAADSAIALMRYLLSKEDLRRVERLNETGQREFLRSFWSARGPGAASTHFARIAEANSRFEVLHRPGWKTDRGRVFVLYGEPDFIDRNYMDAASLNSEVWQYDHIEGGVIFAFLDYNEYGDMELVHSTMRGEIYNPDWKQTASTGRRISPADITR